jgi:hypothetical protein
VAAVARGRPGRGSIPSGGLNPGRATRRPRPRIERFATTICLSRRKCVKRPSATSGVENRGAIFRRAPPRARPPRRDALALPQRFPHMGKGTVD